jgi:hypothetical protein
LVVRIIDNNSFLTLKKQIISGKYKKIYPKIDRKAINCCGKSFVNFISSSLNSEFRRIFRAVNDKDL